MYKQMVPIALTTPIWSPACTIEEQIVLMLSQLTMKDGLLNPFDNVTEDMLFVDANQLDN